jgi:hypothetical protein
MSTAVSMLALGWVFQIGSVQVHGLDTITLSSEDKEADSTTNDSQGFMTHQVALRGYTVKLDGLYLEDGTGAQDPGQLAVENLGAQVGTASLGAFTLTSPGGKTRTFSGSVKMGDRGGKGSEMSKWAAEIKVSGAITLGTGTAYSGFTNSGYDG